MRTALGAAMLGLLFIGACGSTSKDGETAAMTGGGAGAAGKASGMSGSSTVAGTAGSSTVAGTAGTANQGGNEQGGEAGASAGGTPASAGVGAGGALGGGGGGGPVYVGCTSPHEEKVGDLCVAKLVPVPGGYSIDATEVTRGQYQSWLATKPGAPKDARCANVTDFAPVAACVTEQTDGADPEHLPQACVVWCDAIAYCEAVGKRLCGKIGGGANDVESWADVAQSQWFNACSSGGKHVYPYGDEHVADACNGWDAPVPGIATVPVASFTKCQSPEADFSGIYDMSGNVYEFEDSCQVSDFTYCRLRGGAVVGMLECGMKIGTSTTNSDTDIGFRCCKD